MKLLCRCFHIYELILDPQQNFIACVFASVWVAQRLQPVCLVHSWISMCLSVHKGQYLNLDKDHNGMLSKEELSRYGTATLTPVFLDRVFQEYLTYDGEMVQPVTALTAVVTYR